MDEKPYKSYSRSIQVAVFKRPLARQITLSMGVSVLSVVFFIVLFVNYALKNAKITQISFFITGN